MPASISSTFMIEYNQAAGVGAVTIANPGRSFRIIHAVGTGLTSAVITVRKNTGAGDTAAVVSILNAAGGGSDTLTDQPGVLTVANTTFASTDNVHITIATANCTSVKLTCIAESGQALTVS
jgi:hypothetical protein